MLVVEPIFFWVEEGLLGGQDRVGTEYVPDLLNLRVVHLVLRQSLLPPSEVCEKINQAGGCRPTDHRVKYEQYTVECRKEYFISAELIEYLKKPHNYRY